jgi:hypothetical protein
MPRSMNMTKSPPQQSFNIRGNVGLFGQPVNPGDAYVDTAIIGDWDGFGGAATIIGQNPLGLPIIDTSQPGRNIENHVGASDDVLMVANMGWGTGRQFMDRCR